jgi:hypothetical protein
MTIADLIALGWTPHCHDDSGIPYRLEFQDHAFRFLEAGANLRVAEHYQHGRLTGRDFDDTGSYDAALAKLCERRHSTGVVLGEFLRGLARNGP